MLPRSDIPFRIESVFAPAGDQPAAIDDITDRFGCGQTAVCLLGATGTGKTFTMANVIQRIGRPTLIISHNKTLAAQLYEEMRALFPDNAVSYFVSYYDYYQPEAYIPARDIYIEKDASRNDELDQLRLAATSNLMARRDTIVVASVSCIFGLGSPAEFGKKVLSLSRGMTIQRRDLFVGLSRMQYERSEFEFKRASFRVRGDVIDVYPSHDKYGVRIEIFGDEIEALQLIEPTSGEVIADESHVFIFPAVHYMLPEEDIQQAVQAIREELDQQVLHLRGQGKLLEAQRLIARTRYDLEMIEEVGYCSGIENYSRHLDGRAPGERPYTLLDYFRYGAQADGEQARSSGGSGGRGGWLLIIDESHVTIPQVRAMYNGDRARKQVLVDHGFRLPSALDNRPLRFDEFEQIVPQVLFASATPAAYELERTSGEVVEQIIRPTGLVDPAIEVRPARNQVPNLMQACKERVEQGDRVLVTALTKRLCEDLTTYLGDQGFRVRYLHSDIETLERIEILTSLREGEFDVLVGVNLLREGLDLPEVSLVCILDADKEGFLRSATSLIQQIGRAARNVCSKVILYADRMTPSMSKAIDETDRRRSIQLAYNKKHDITPTTIRKAIRRGIERELKAQRTARDVLSLKEEQYDRVELLRQLEQDMLAAAKTLDFEKAAALRDRIKRIKESPEFDGACAGDEGPPPGTPGRRKKPRRKRTSWQ
ncbi:MAG: excinuclease ABC subunit UvrB [Phycisphaerales bacterium]|nr:excinuclease ABC subunit UvrB [Phycisphaerales bacterium]